MALVFLVDTATVQEMSTINVAFVVVMTRPVKAVTVSNSGLVNDACGECDGDDSSCSGCDGIPNSGLVIDACGECDGDGDTCEDEDDDEDADEVRTYDEDEDIVIYDQGSTAQLCMVVAVFVVYAF